MNLRLRANQPAAATLSEVLMASLALLMRLHKQALQLQLSYGTIIDANLVMCSVPGIPRATTFPTLGGLVMLICFP